MCVPHCCGTLLFFHSECTNGAARCSEKGCNAVDGSGVKFEMGFAGNYDDYKDVTEQEELIRWVWVVLG